MRVFSSFTDVMSNLDYKTKRKLYHLLIHEFEVTMTLNDNRQSLVTVYLYSEPLSTIHQIVNEDSHSYNVLLGGGHAYTTLRRIKLEPITESGPTSGKQKPFPLTRQGF